MPLSSHLPEVQNPEKLPLWLYRNMVSKVIALRRYGMPSVDIFLTLRCQLSPSLGSHQPTVLYNILYPCPAIDFLHYLEDLFF